MNHSEAERLVSALLPLSAEERARADMYALSAHLLLAAPEHAFLAGLAAADSLPASQPGHPLDRAWEQLMLAASLTNTEQVEQEFNALFVNTGTPILNPHASLYLAGSMMAQPLAALRSELARLGLERIQGVAELEDHLGALCEAMRIMIGGEQGAERQPLPVQQAFFEAYLASWYARCLDDIRNAEGASFYQRAADLIQAFLDIEAEAFRIEQTGQPSQTLMEGVLS